MRTAIVIAPAALMILPGQANAGYGVEAQKRALRCSWTTVEQAFHGDFSKWALPNVVRGNHLRAGQYVDENCVVRGSGR